MARKYQEWADAIQYSHPFVASSLLKEIVKTYKHEATDWDSKARVRRRAARSP